MQHLKSARAHLRTEAALGGPQLARHQVQAAPAEAAGAQGQARRDRQQESRQHAAFSQKRARHRDADPWRSQQAAGTAPAPQRPAA
eukprot:9466676-Pyramimonas_sp.AAC.1